MSYSVVFDLDRSGYPFWWLLLLVAAVGGLAGTVLLTFGGRHERARQIGSVFVVLVPLFALGMLVVTFSDYRSLKGDLDSGRVSVVEGPVSNYQPMKSGSRGEYESFTVKGVEFTYNGFALTSAFDKPAFFGGPIREGIQVRVTYVGDSIVRLEVAK
jgi:hypothetical protein